MRTGLAALVEPAVAPPEAGEDAPLEEEPRPGRRPAPRRRQKRRGRARWLDRNSDAGERALQRFVVRAGLSLVAIVVIVVVGAATAGSYRSFADESWSLPAGTYDVVELEGTKEWIKYEVDATGIVDAYACESWSGGKNFQDLLDKFKLDLDAEGGVRFHYLKSVSRRRTRAYASGGFRRPMLGGAILIVNRDSREVQVRVNVWTK